MLYVVTQVNLRRLSDSNRLIAANNLIEFPFPPVSCTVAKFCDSADLRATEQLKIDVMGVSRCRR